MSARAWASIHMFKQTISSCSFSHLIRDSTISKILPWGGVIVHFQEFLNIIFGELDSMLFIIYFLENSFCIFSNLLLMRCLNYFSYIYIQFVFVVFWIVNFKFDYFMVSLFSMLRKAFVRHSSSGMVIFSCFTHSSARHSS